MYQLLAYMMTSWRFINQLCILCVYVCMHVCKYVCINNICNIKFEIFPNINYTRKYSYYIFGKIDDLIKEITSEVKEGR